MTDSTKDYAVAAVDPYESSLQPTSPHPSSNLPAGGQGLMEGKGMLSWNLAEKREGTTWVCGRVVRDAAEDQRRVRRKLNRPSATTTRRDHDSEQDTEDDDNVDDEDEEKDTLEVWLQLVEVRVFPLRLDFRVFLDTKSGSISSAPLSHKLNSSPHCGHSPIQLNRCRPNPLIDLLPQCPLDLFLPLVYPVLQRQDDESLSVIQSRRNDLALLILPI